jgi:short chain dehydrogenase
MSEPDVPVLERFSLAGKIALVTGVSSGLGAGFAVALAQAGADVVLAARRLDRLEAISREIEKLGRSALAVSADVTDPEACRAVVQAAVGRFGRLDVLINDDRPDPARQGGRVRRPDLDPRTDGRAARTRHRGRLPGQPGLVLHRRRDPGRGRGMSGH